MVSAELILSLGKGAGELPSQGPFQTFFSTALKKKSMTLTLFGLIQSVEMTWYLFPCSPYSPAACTHSSFMHLSTFSFFPLDSTIIYCTCQAIFSAVSSASLTGRMQTNCVEQTLLCRRKQ